MNLFTYMAGGLLDLGECGTGFHSQLHSGFHICRDLVSHHLVGAGDQAGHLGNRLLNLAGAEVRGL
ncbi:hypothetical protein D3C73_1287930 [compost metagenome]